MGIWYCTREDIQQATEINYAARFISTIDNAIEAASRTVEAAPMRRFYPIFNDTKTYNWPAIDRSDSLRLWFDTDFISIDSITAGGINIPSTDYVLQPANTDDKPFRWLQIKDNATNFLQSAGERIGAIVVVGTTGYTQNTTLAGDLVTNITDEDDTISADLGMNAGVGSLLKIGTEWVQVTDRYWESSTDVLTADLDKMSSSVTVNAATASGYCPGEYIRIGAEIMRVESFDSYTGTFIVERNIVGSVLAAHTTGATILRRTGFKIERGQVGTTAVAHAGSEPVEVWQTPGLIKQWVIGEAMTNIQQTVSSYGRTVGTGDNTIEARGVGLADIRYQARKRYRKPRIYRSVA